MTALQDAASLWLVNFCLASTLLLGVTLVFMRLVNQPARRIVVAWSGVIALLALAVLPLLPLWPQLSIRPHLGVVESTLPVKRGKPQSDHHNVSSAAQEPAQTPHAAPEWRRRGEASITPPQPARLPPLASDASAAWRRIQPWGLIAFCAGSVLAGMRSCLGAVRIEQLSRRATKAPDRLVQMLARVSGPGRVPCLLVSSEVSSPIACGVLKPTIILPELFLGGASDSAIEMGLSHEWAHIRRRDLWLLGLSRLLVVLLYPHPGYWRLRRWVRDDQDLLADAAAAERTDRPEYAETLLAWAREAVAPTASPQLAAIGMWGRPGQLTRRITYLLKDDYDVETEVSRGWVLRTAGVVLLIALALSLLSLRSPASAVPPVVIAANAPEVPDEGSIGRPALASAQGGQLSGVVLDAAGNPLRGVLVDRCPWVTGHETTTNAKGRFTLTGFNPAVDAQIRFSKLGYSPKLFLSKPVDDQDWVVSLDDKTYIEGRVLDMEGRPAAAALIRANRGPKRSNGILIRYIGTSTYSDSNGRYRLHVEPDTYEVRARKPGGGVAVHDRLVSVSHGEQRKLDMRLRPGVSFQAEFVDRDTGEPVEGVSIQAWRHEGIRGTSDKAGRLAIEDIPRGVYRFEIDANRYARWWTDDFSIRVMPHGRVQIGALASSDPVYLDLQPGMGPTTFSLERSALVAGIVVDPVGRPVAGATISVVKTGSGNSITGDTRFTTRSSAEGAFSLEVPAGYDRPYNLVAHDSREPTKRWWANGVSKPLRLNPGDTAEGLRLEFTRPASIAGQVVDQHNRPVSGRRVRAHAMGGDGNRYFDPETTTDAQGKFLLSRVRPGEHRIQASPFRSHGAGATKKDAQEVVVSSGERLESVLLTIPE